MFSAAPFSRLPFSDSGQPRFGSSGVGTSAGVGIATGKPAMVGIAAGVGTATGKPASVGTAAGVGAATGKRASIGTAAGVSAATGKPASIGTAAGSASVVGVGTSAFDEMLSDEDSQLVYFGEIVVWQLTDRS